ncbi:Inositol-pentakisphosphate 2-kinase [Ceratobasidium sp. UAMH 11750]|nr:Inositol-pentakisphosphate 2-kinase [Ceratobasidium sp. UAMH 11750]
MSKMNGQDRDLDRLELPDRDDATAAVADSPTVVEKSGPWTPAVADNEVVPNLSSTHPRHWKYISEGGATIVFSYRGPPHDVFSHSVVRLRKCVRATPALEDIKEVGIGNSETVNEEGAIVKPLEIAEESEQKVKARGSNESLRSVRSAHSARSLLLNRSNTTLQAPPNDSDSDSDWQDANPDADNGADDQPDAPTIEFQTRVTSRLVPLCYLPRLETARMGRRWVEELARIGERARPEARRRVDGIDVARRKGVLADDLVGWEGWAVEIKPKWAFLPNGMHLSEETSVHKLARCRFCMHGFHGSKAGKERGGYCPLDLFSGDEPRIRKALGALWETWVKSDGAINNLKVFVKGKTVKPQSDPHFKQLASFLKEEPGPDGMKDAFVAAIAPMLHKSPLLGTLSTLMRSLDALDIEGVEKLWKEAKHFPMAGLAPPIAEDEDEPSLADWEKFVDEYLVHGAYVGSGKQYDPEHPKEENLTYWLLSYLMSATFKDCSIMLRFPPGQVEGTFFNPERDVSMPLVTAIDLDPKSMKRLQKWAELDRDIVQTYGAAVKDGVADDSRCVDARVISHVGGGAVGAAV